MLVCTCAPQWDDSGQPLPAREFFSMGENALHARRALKLALEKSGLLSPDAIALALGAKHDGSKASTQTCLAPCH